MKEWFFIYDHYVLVDGDACTQTTLTSDSQEGDDLIWYDCIVEKTNLAKSYESVKTYFLDVCSITPVYIL